MVFRFITLNCNGLRSNLKRKSVFKYLKKYRYDIICLQETFVKDSDIEQWSKEWKGGLFHCSGTSHSKGQVILTHQKVDISGVKVEISQDPIIAISFIHNGEAYVVVNVYGPNEDREKHLFLNELEIVLNKYKESHRCLLAGDFNMVLDNKLDILAGHPHDNKTVQEFNDLISATDHFDIWRLHNGSSTEFTWAKYSNPFIARRLDYIFANSLIFDQIVSCNIVSVPNSDHRGVEIEMVTDSITRGPSYWKFNDSLLHDAAYAKKINEKIEWCESNLTNFPDQLKWDYCKIQIKELSIAYSKHKAARQRDDLKRLRVHLENLQKNASSNASNEVVINEIKDTKLALDIYSLHDAKGAQTRSRVKWIEDGETNTKFFLNLEKMNNKKNTMRALINSEGKLCTNKEDIMQIQVNYYKRLYSEKFKLNDRMAQYESFCKNLSIPQLGEEQKELCEGMITDDEASYALSCMKNGSAPGSDGLTTAFYKFFWSKIRDMVINSYNESFDEGKLSSSQRRAIITLIHKGKDLPREMLGNWRPISLTNTDYKSLAKTLALRLQKVIPDLVFEDQVGYIRGRNISTIIRLIDDVLEYIKMNNNSGVLLALDFSKAFDTINKDFLIEVFNKFGFGEMFIRWVGTLTNDTESSIQYSGWLSEFFPVNSGIRQGCNFSPLAFVLAVEILAIKIRQCNKINGILLPGQYENIEVKLAQYADDTTLLLNDNSDVIETLTVLEDFKSFSGLHLNMQKTEAMWVGKTRPTDLCEHITWKNGDSDTIKILGVQFSNNMPASQLEDNWKKRIETIVWLIKLWEQRNLSIMGKIQIVKTFLLSQLIYIMQAISLPNQVLREINTILFKFIWKKRYSNRRAFEKVKRDIICQNYEHGGLKMVSIIDMQNTFLIQWVKKITMNFDSKFVYLPMYYYGELGMDLSVFGSNISSKHFQGLHHIKSLFWRNVLCSWLDSKGVITYDDIPTTEIYNQIIWNNDIIRFKGNVIMWKSWISGGFVYIGDLFVDDPLCDLRPAGAGAGET